MMRRHTQSYGWVRRAAIAGMLIAGATTALAADCPGDCNRNGVVQIDELVRGVRIALDEAPVIDCVAIDSNNDGQVTVERTVNGQAVISKGLTAGEKVATDGQLRLTDGTRVQIVSDDTAKPGDAS